MSTLPVSDLEQIQFMEAHAPVWAAAPTTVGLTAATCMAITAAVAGARKAYNDAQSARDASKAATVNQHGKIAVMHALAADAIRTIRIFAEASASPSTVYTAAQIDPPAPPTAALPPTQAVMIRASIETNGALTLGWKAGPSFVNPTTGQAYDASTAGVTYLVTRKVNNETAFSFVGIADAARSGSRGLASFTDGSLIAGSTNIQYIITSRRGGSAALAGPMSDVFSVTLGVAAGGGLTIASQSSTPMKLAA